MSGRGDRWRGGRGDDLGRGGGREGQRQTGGAGDLDRDARGRSLFGHHRELQLYRLLAPDRLHETDDLTSLGERRLEPPLRAAGDTGVAPARAEKGAWLVSP